MTTEERTNNEGKRKQVFDFPFRGFQEMKALMGTWCPPQAGCCSCCPATKKTEDQESK